MVDWSPVWIWVVPHGLRPQYHSRPRRSYRSTDWSLACPASCAKLRVLVRSSRPTFGELAKSTAVFMGQVVSVRESDKGLLGWSSSDPTMVEFDVRTVWKGSNYQTICLTTARSGASFGFTFVEGVEYVVYSRDGSTVSLCSRTRTRSEAAHDLAELADLGTGRLASQGASAPRPDVSGGRCGLSPDTTDLSAVGLMVGIAWLGLRKKRCDTR